MCFSSVQFSSIQFNFYKCSLNFISNECAKRLVSGFFGHTKGERRWIVTIAFWLLLEIRRKYLFVLLWFSSPVLVFAWNVLILLFAFSVVSVVTVLFPFRFFFVYTLHCSDINTIKSTLCCLRNRINCAKCEYFRLFWIYTYKYAHRKNTSFSSFVEHCNSIAAEKKNVYLSKYFDKSMWPLSETNEFVRCAFVLYIIRWSERQCSRNEINIHTHTQ